MAEELVPQAPQTVGLSPKVPAQAVVTVIVFVFAHFGVDLEPELALALATVLGALAGVVARPGTVIRRAA